MLCFSFQCLSSRNLFILSFRVSLFVYQFVLRYFPFPHGLYTQYNNLCLHKECTFQCFLTNTYISLLFECTVLCCFKCLDVIQVLEQKEPLYGLLSECKNILCTFNTADSLNECKHIEHLYGLIYECTNFLCCHKLPGFLKDVLNKLNICMVCYFNVQFLHAHLNKKVS